LSPLESHAVMIAGKPAAKLRDHLAAGNGQAVDVTVRLVGSINVGEPQTQTVCKKPDAGEVLALVLNGLSPMDRDNAVKRVTRLYAPFTRGEAPPTVTGPVQALADQLLVSCAQSTTRESRGNVTGAIDVQLVARPRRKAAA
jgi:hypothetical protein